MRRTIRRWIWWALALGWAAGLFLLAGQSGEESGSLSLKVTEFVLRVFPFVPLSVEQMHPVLRKLAHFCTFAVEGALFAAASAETFSKKPAIVISVVFCAAVAALNEYSQTFAVGRSCEARDMLIDFSGALLGIAVVALIRRRHENKN